jgi:hypothetical protein
MQTIGYTSVQRHKAFRGFVPEHRYTVHSAEGRKAWELQHYTELEALLLKWQQALAILIKSQVFTDGVYDFFAKRKLYFGFEQARLFEILMSLEDRYGVYYPKDITNAEIAIIQSVQKDVYEGILVHGVRIFPEVYYPYMDKRYFDHINWNKQPEGVAIADVLQIKGNYILASLAAIPSVNNQIGKGSCGCSGCGGSGTQNYVKIMNQVIPMVKDVNWIQVLSHEDYIDTVKGPYIFIGYWVKGGGVLPRELAQCHCITNKASGHATCTTPYQGASLGQWCGRSPCSKAACGCGTKDFPEICM